MATHFFKWKRLNAWVLMVLGFRLRLQGIMKRWSQQSCLAWSDKFTLKSGLKCYLQCKVVYVIWQAFNAFTPSRHRHSGQSDLRAWNINLSAASTILQMIRINNSFCWALHNSSFFVVALQSFCQKCPSFRYCVRTVRWSVTVTQ